MKEPDNSKNRVKLLTVCLFIIIGFNNVSAEPRSGFEYITEETRAIQSDDFSNPGMIVLDQGRELFNTENNTSGNRNESKSCASCHGVEGEKLDKKKIASYPVYNESQKEIISLQKQVSNCRSKIIKDSLNTDHPELIALETFVRNTAFGEKVNMKTDGAVSELIVQGEVLYKTRYGLIDMSCYHCHDLYPGQMIRGQKISQGQLNGFPTYRLDIGEVVSIGQRIQQCLSLLRAEPFDTDSEEIRLLSLYLMSRSNGLPIETPSVRY